MNHPLSRNRPAKSHETCAVSDREFWKRDALLFDKIYVPKFEERDDIPSQFDIPSQLTFNLDEFESARSRMGKGFGLSMAYGGNATEEQINFALYGEEDPGNVEVASIRHIANTGCSKGLDVTPIYESIPLFYTEFSEGVRVAYDAAINNLPIIDNERVSWEQILDFRTDKESVRKYRDLRTWLEHGLKAKSEQHATDIICSKIEDYAWSIRKHGIETRIGAFTQIVDWKKTSYTAALTGAAGIVGGPIAAALTTGVLVSANIGVWIAQRNLELEDIKRANSREVAILYDAQKTFGDKQ